MYNPDKAMVMFDQLSAAGKHGTLSLKILLHTYIEEREPLISETAKALKVSAPAISRTLDKLENKGLMRRKREEKGDKREVRVFLTGKGSLFIDKMLGP